MSDEANTLSTLDTAVRAHAEDLVDDGEVITNWVVLIATRTSGGGQVQAVVSDDDLPTYLVRGMLDEVRARIDRAQASLTDDDDE